ncbi:uncharacterized protein [Amphiura filiformis]|uniref:uncharacterized protein n=1 Tax=Amphiura filiformis TaxID=82378 RepID=UPI003B21AB26
MILFCVVLLLTGTSLTLGQGASVTSCNPNPCLNGGVCSETGLGTNPFTCTCGDGFAGSICQYSPGELCPPGSMGSQACGSKTCLNRNVTGEPDYVCVCTDRFQMGFDCNVNNDNRFLNSCYGATCVDRVDRFGNPFNYFESPGYPGLYPNRLRALYLLYIPGVTEICLDFDQTAFDVENNKDELYVGPGLQFDFKDLGGRSYTPPEIYFFENKNITNGGRTPQNFCIPSDTIWMYFLTDYGIMLNGWRLYWRISDVDECASFPCENQGTCTDKVNGFICTCREGFIGERCQTDINECASFPCENQGTCTDMVDGFMCTCTEGFSGIRCQTDINECASSPCENQGTCTDMVNGYMCTCREGFTGERCQTDVCNPNPCLNGGACSATKTGIDPFTCTCGDGFAGSICQYSPGELCPPGSMGSQACGSKTCLNRNVTGKADYVCVCTDPLRMGFDCNVEEYTRLLDSCYGSSCVDRIDRFGNPLNYFESPGYPDHSIRTNGALYLLYIPGVTEICFYFDQTAFRIETFKDELYVGPGLQFDPDDLWYDVATPPEIFFFETSNITNGGRTPQSFCIPSDTVWMYSIEDRSLVDKVWRLYWTISDVDECASSPCENRGTCTDMVNGFTCTCKEGFIGERCQTSEHCAPESLGSQLCGSKACFNRNVTGEPNYVCACEDSYKMGFDCNVDSENTVLNSCYGTSCVDRLDRYFYPGNYFESPRSYVYPSFNEEIQRSLYLLYIPGVTEICFDFDQRFSFGIENGTDELYVGPGLQFDYADLGGDVATPPEIYFFKSGNIANGGRTPQNFCIPSDTVWVYFFKDRNINRYYNNGWRLYWRISDINECTSSPCENQGTCTDKVNGFICTCKETFAGERCQDTDECASSPCENQGTCTDMVNGFICTCTEGFTGKRCQTSSSITPCNPNPCLNGGVCSETQTGQGTNPCTCADGFAGGLCQYSPGELCPPGSMGSQACGSKTCLNRNVTGVANYVCVCEGQFRMGFSCNVYSDNRFLNSCYGAACLDRIDRFGNPFNYFESPGYPGLYEDRIRALYLLYIPGVTEICFDFDQTAFGIENVNDELYVGPGLQFHFDDLRGRGATPPEIYFFENRNIANGGITPQNFCIPSDTVWMYFLTSRNIVKNGGVCIGEYQAVDVLTIHVCMANV